ncbi:MAG: hypothetical protein ABW321_33955 [Polyangiales bacterium]
MASLSSEALKEIEATIAELEQRTAAELVVMEVGRSAGYGEIKLGYALAASLAASAIAQLLWPDVPGAWHLWLQLGVALLTLALTSVPFVLRGIVPRALLTQWVEQRARLAFFDHHLFATRDRTGVLIMLSQLERRVVILGDAGIHAKIHAEGWKSHVDHIVKAIHAGKTGQGVCETLRAIGETLIAEFPPRADDVDELSNAVRRADR